MKPNFSRRNYWGKLLLATILGLLLALAGTILWISDRQAFDYLHPARNIASGAFLQANGSIFRTSSSLPKIM